jgi:hypothetical protein
MRSKNRSNARKKNRRKKRDQSGVRHLNAPLDKTREDITAGVLR